MDLPKSTEQAPAWHHSAGESQFLRQQTGGFGSREPDNDSGAENLAVSGDGECRFEIYRKHETRVTSTSFSGGDWRWRLVTTDGLVLAEAAGYANQATCSAAVAVLKKQAADAPVETFGGGEE